MIQRLADCEKPSYSGYIYITSLASVAQGTDQKRGTVRLSKPEYQEAPVKETLLDLDEQHWNSGMMNIRINTNGWDGIVPPIDNYRQLITTERGIISHTLG